MEVIRLNLGCGAKRWKGFVNVDMAQNWTGLQPDVVADIFGPLPFPDDYADEVHAIHVLEHTHVWKAEEVLREWTRVLKPGGLMVLELPCLDKIINLFQRYIEEGIPLEPQYTLWGLYGDPGYKNDAMCHKWCWSAGALSNLMNMCGLSVKMAEPKFHVPFRDMRLEGVKRGDCESGGTAD